MFICSRVSFDWVGNLWLGRCRGTLLQRFLESAKFEHCLNSEHFVLLSVAIKCLSCIPAEYSVKTEQEWKKQGMKIMVVRSCTGCTVRLTASHVRAHGHGSHQHQVHLLPSTPTQSFEFHPINSSPCFNRSFNDHSSRHPDLASLAIFNEIQTSTRILDRL